MVILVNFLKNGLLNRYKLKKGGDDMNFIKNIMKESTKTEKLMVIILVIVIVSTLLSFLAQELSKIKTKEDTSILLVTSLKDNDAIANSLKIGAQTYIEQQNAQKTGKYNYQIDILDENIPNLVDVIKKKKLQNKYVAVIGSFKNDRLKEYQNDLSSLDIPILSLSDSDEEKAENFYYFSENTKEKAQFVANYMRNVKKEHITYIAHDNSTECQIEQKEFEEVYKRFEIPISGTVSTEQDIRQYFSNVDYGAVYVCGDSVTLPKILNEIKASGTILNTYANEIISLNGVKSSFNDPSTYLHGITTPSHFMYDTTNEVAQSFLNFYDKKNSDMPDWQSAIGYDLAKIAFSMALEPSKETIEGVIGAYNTKENQFKFPIKMGIFNGSQLISAPIQLQEIENKQSISNYIEALRDSRVLYVNNKFMYKTNVVYTGLKLNSISNIRDEEGLAQIDFSIWFRYEGNFDPSAISFLNSDIKLEHPIEKIDKENNHYIRFRQTGDFKLNFSGKDRAYGQDVINIVYRHQKLNKNNLLFVVDILGMPGNKEILEYAKKRKILEEDSGWEANDLLITQNLLKDYSEGEPQYVGHMGESPVFSTINLELQLRSSSMNAKDLVANDYFIFLFMLGTIGVITARLMDSQRMGKYWHMQSFGLRVLFLPIFIISSGNMILDWAFTHLNPQLSSNLVMVYESLWWLTPAYLLDMAIKRFVWERLEDKAEKKVPQIIVLVVSFVIYVLAFSGLIAFVLHQELTSILAASGVLAMVIGLAIKSNIANIFSGLVLNMDKPFRVNDRIVVFYNNKLKLEGNVKDIGWRTTKLVTIDGMHLTIPNDRISNAFALINYSRGSDFEESILIHLEVNIDPERVFKLIEQALENADFYLKEEKYKPKIVFNGIIEGGTNWVSEYKILYKIHHVSMRGKAKTSIWNNLHSIFLKEGLIYTPGEKKDQPKMDTIKQIPPIVKEEPIQDDLE